MIEEKVLNMVSDALDSSRVIETGKANPKGMKSTLTIRNPSLDLIKEITVLKSDVAIVSIPEIELEEAPGVGRLFTMEALLEEMTDKLRNSSFSYAGLAKVVKTLENFLEGNGSFTMVIDDPLALSQFLVPGEHIEDCDLKEDPYERSWDQNEELGLLEVKENEDEEEESVRKLVQLLKNAKNVTGFTGAGVSVESGIPPYRGGDENSIWTKYDPQIANVNFFMASEENQAQFWRLETELYEILDRAEPNPSHGIFAHLEKHGKLNKIVTQNIDGLHEKSGVPEYKVIHLHGTSEECNCLHCCGIAMRDGVYAQLLEGKKIPECTVCEGPLRPSTILFGEKLDPKVVQEAKDSMKECDLLLLMGSSLVVQPANRLPAICLERGVPVVIINKEGETQYDKFADLVIRGPSGHIMKRVLEQLED